MYHEIYLETYLMEAIVNRRTQSFFSDAGGAVKEFEAAVKLKPGDADYRLNLGVAYLQKADFDAAIREFETALSAMPNAGWSVCGWPRETCRRDCPSTFRAPTSK